LRLQPGNKSCSANPPAVASHLKSACVRVDCCLCTARLLHEPVGMPFWLRSIGRATGLAGCPSSIINAFLARRSEEGGAWNGRTTASLACIAPAYPLSVPLCSLCHGAHVLDCWLRCSRVSRPSLSRHRRSLALPLPRAIRRGAWRCYLLLLLPNEPGSEPLLVSTTGQTRTTYSPPSDHCHTSPIQHTTDDDDDVAGHSALASTCTL
jgi:hypothetical protein